MKTSHWILAAMLTSAASVQAAPASGSVFSEEQTVVTLASQGPFESEEVAEQVLDDTVLTAGVVAALVTDSRIDDLNLAVETQEGVVTLSGDAASDEERRRAIELAASIDGVCEVRDNIRLQQ